MLKRLFILSVFLFSGNVGALSQIELNELEKANESAKKYIEVYIDSSNKLMFEDLVSETEEWDWIPLEDLNEDYTSTPTYWLRISIRNPFFDSKSLGIDISNLNHIVDIHIKGNRHGPLSTGFYRSSKENKELLPVTNIIELPEEEYLDLYISIKNITDEKPDFQLVFVDIKNQIKKKLYTTIFDSFLLGMMWIMILYGLFLYLLIRDTLYLHYSLYALFLSIWYIVCFEFGYTLFPSLPREFYPYSDTPVLIAMLFYIQFIKFFINIPNTLPTWNKILSITQLVIIIITIGMPVYMMITNNIYLGYQLYSGFSLILILTLSFLVVKLFRSNIPYSTIIAVGSSFLMLGVALGVIIWFVNYDYSYFYQKVGTIIELIVFTFGISLRYSKIEKEKVLFQEKAIKQLEENVRIQETAKKDLEIKVKERTAEISEKNEILYDQNDEIKAQRDMLLSQHNSIQESIRYASRIQSAILPADESIQYFLPKHFILYKPRDIVSGDFYWFGTKEEKVVIAVVDCTGHGVPGAFMSMLGSSLLNEIVNSVTTLNSNEILDELRDRVIIALRQTGKLGEAKDGMDMTLCILDNKKQYLQFSGSNNDLIIIRKGEIIELKGDRMPIGISSSAGKPFQQQRFDLLKGDTIYMFTDGLVDQFGGPKGKKILRSRFKELLLKVQHNIMFEQKEIIEQELHAWMHPVSDSSDSYEQVDDILVIGIKV